MSEMVTWLHSLYQSASEIVLGINWVEFGKSIAPWAAVGSVLFAVLSISIAAKALIVTTRTNKAKFVYDLTEGFLKEPGLKQFWYRLDYDQDDQKAWRFVLKDFRHSEDERLLDTLLYKFVVVGHMLKTKAITLNDVEGLFTMCRQTIRNAAVQEYLLFNKLDFWLADRLKNSNFDNALYFYERITRHLLKNKRITKQEYVKYKLFSKKLTLIPYHIIIQKEAAQRIGYPVKEFRVENKWTGNVKLVRAAPSDDKSTIKVAGQPTAQNQTEEQLPPLAQNQPLHS